MAVIILDKIDPAPVASDDFSFEVNSWFANTVDVLNEVIIDTENQFNGTGTPYGPTRLTQAEILALDGAGELDDGVYIYCTDHVPPCYVGRISGVLVQFVTAAFP